MYLGLSGFNPLHRLQRMLPVTLFLLFPTLTWGAPAVPAEQSADPETANEKTASPLAQRLSLTLYAGQFQPSDNGGQIDQRGRKYNWGFSAGYILNPYLLVEGEFLWLTADYRRLSNSLVPGTSSNDIRIISTGVNINARFSYPVGRFIPFLTLGAGYFSSELFTEDENDSGFTAEGPPSPEDVWSSQYSLGLAYPLTETFQLEARWRSQQIDADFGIYSQGKIDAGGSSLEIALRFGRVPALR